MRVEGVLSGYEGQQALQSNGERLLVRAESDLGDRHGRTDLPTDLSDILTTHRGLVDQPRLGSGKGLKRLLSAVRRGALLRETPRRSFAGIGISCDGVGPWLPAA
jgi:hypothetical protein